MGKYEEKEKNGKYPCLYDVFDLGDRVKRLYNDKYGKSREYKGIILAIDNNAIEIYWDTKDGKYCPDDTDIYFTHCDLEEIFKGNEKYSPIKKYNE